MRRVLLTAFAAVLLAGSTATVTPAAPTGTHFSIAGHAQMVSPTTLLVEVTLSCQPFTFGGGTPGTGFVFLSVQSLENGAIGFGSTGGLICDGSPHTAVVVVNGGPFVPGRAIATGSGCGFLCDSDTRRIQIVV